MTKEEDKGGRIDKFPLPKEKKKKSRYSVHKESEHE